MSMANSNLSRKFRVFFPAALCVMRDLFMLVVHLIATVFRLARPGGLRAVVAESVLTKHQMLILNRSRRRAPNLRIQDRLIAGLCSLWIKPSRLRKVALAFKTSTLLSFHRALVQRKYRLLFSPKQRTKPGPKGLLVANSASVFTLFLHAIVTIDLVNRAGSVPLSPSSS